MLNKDKTASLDVDAQNSFTPLCPNELPVPEGTDIVPELNLQATFAKYRIGTKEGHSTHAIWASDPDHPALTTVTGRSVDIRWPMHCVPGTKGFELIEGLPHPIDYDFFIWKGIEPDMHPYGGCYHDIQETLSTGLIEFLTAHGIDTVIVGGLALDYCVKQTVLQLLRAGFKIIVNLGACRSLTESGSAAAIREMNALGAQFIETAHALS